ncbi:MAG: CBS domain-containing protein [Leptospiraceae bacterium]|nr:CBS domain-containing protein [Leptospiraceae bacterium]MCK6381532.1 CBS domain-containing protein [Leptospiraceae bacterium]NUM40671.1 CBS domain-containing protein [Leptospiraceae bacterium]
MENILSRTEKLLRVKVKDIMSTNLVTVDADDLIGKASRLMIENRMHSLLVMKNAKPTYMISTYDLIKVSYEDTFSEDSADMLRTQVEELVKGQKMASVNSEDFIIDVLKIIVDYNFHSLPVIDEGIVKGVVTLMDLAKWYMKTHEELQR